MVLIIFEYENYSYTGDLSNFNANETRWCTVEQPFVYSDIKHVVMLQEDVKRKSYLIIIIKKFIFLLFKFQ